VNDLVMRMTFQPTCFLPMSLIADKEYAADALFTLVHETAHYQQFLMSMWYWKKVASLNVNSFAQNTLTPIKKILDARCIKHKSSIDQFFSSNFMATVKLHPFGMHRTRMTFALKAFEASWGGNTEKLKTEIPAYLPQPPSLPEPLQFKGWQRFANAARVKAYYDIFIPNRAQLAQIDGGAPLLIVDPPVALDRSVKAANYALVPLFKDLVFNDFSLWDYDAGSWSQKTWNAWDQIHKYELGYNLYMYWSFEENNAYSIERHFEQILRGVIGGMQQLDKPWEYRRVKFLMPFFLA